MAGFNIPAQVLGTDDFKKMAQLFISPDGHSVRYFIQTDLNPFSTEAMDQVKSILDTAKGAQPNTTLADASISMSGYPVTLRDTRDYYDRDIRLIVDRDGHRRATDPHGVAARGRGVRSISSGR